MAWGMSPHEFRDLNSREQAFIVAHWRKHAKYAKEAAGSGFGQPGGQAGLTNTSFTHN